MPPVQPVEALIIETEDRRTKLVITTAHYQSHIARGFTSRFRHRRDLVDPGAMLVNHIPPVTIVESPTDVAQQAMMCAKAPEPETGCLCIESDTDEPKVLR